MKNFKKAFTLVEMLIVVVIIGILSSALLPRLQGAQSSARDSARRSDLNQLGSAIISYYNNRGEYPRSGSDKSDWNMTGADSIAKDLVEVVELSSMPSDPNSSNSFVFSGKEIKDGKYGYMLAKKNSIKNGGFVLMARAETEGGANYLSGLTAQDDLKDWKTCVKFNKTTADSNSISETGLCLYKEKSDLRYIYTF